jgi:hypothetical protein
VVKIFDAAVDVREVDLRQKPSSSRGRRLEETFFARSMPNFSGANTRYRDTKTRHYN